MYWGHLKLSSPSFRQNIPKNSGPAGREPRFAGPDRRNPVEMQKIPVKRGACSGENAAGGTARAQNSQKTVRSFLQSWRSWFGLFLSSGGLPRGLVPEKPGQFLEQHSRGGRVGPVPVVDEVKLPGEQGAVEVKGQNRPHLYIVAGGQTLDDRDTQAVFDAL